MKDEKSIKNNLPDVVKWIESRRWEWRMHVERMGEDRMAKIAYKEKPNARRRMDCPKKIGRILDINVA